MIKWIFFDIGNVILNDDPAMAFFYHEIFQAIQQNGKQVTLDEVLAARERSILLERIWELCSFLIQPCLKAA